MAFDTKTSRAVRAWPRFAEILRLAFAGVQAAWARQDYEHGLSVAWAFAGAEQEYTSCGSAAFLNPLLAPAVADWGVVFG